MRAPRLVLVLLAAITVFVAGWASAQIAQNITPVIPRVLTGEDFGFRHEGYRGGTAVGRLVIRLNGEWVEADPSGGPTVRRSTE